MELSNKTKMALALLLISFIMIGIAITLEKEPVITRAKNNTQLNETIKSKEETLGIKVETNKEDIKTITEYMDIPIEKRDKFKAEKIISKFIYSLNIKDYNGAYNMLNKDYCEKFNMTFSLFKVKYTFEKERMYIVKDIQKKGAKLIANIILVEKEKAETIDKNIPFTKKTVSIYEDDSIDDIGLIETWKKNKEEVKGNVEIKVVEEMVLLNSMVFKVKIKNTSEKDIIKLNDDSMGIYAKDIDTTYKHKMINNDPTIYNLNPKQEKEILIAFEHAEFIQTITFKFDNNSEITINL